MWKKFKAFLLKIKTNSYVYISHEAQIKGRTYRLRLMQESDIKEVLAVERDVYFGEVPWTRSNFLLELRNPLKHLYLVITDNEKVIGFAGSRVRRENCHITNIAVASTHQNQGIGTYLLNEVKKYGKEMNAKELSLEVRMSNKNAQRLYRRFGFVSEKVLKGYYTEIKDDGLRMVYALKEEEHASN
ncbi:MAG: ribosomal protein S18-alanine N-acetyltransferase [Streptococcaceae bacterium]|jgi:ribosomal-protein-alanine N-acetyltransferase|nr:ribosomal protein S18-alanine N-acetyltransferase [Streptococcaceae bacterium]